MSTTSQPLDNNRYHILYFNPNYKEYTCYTLPSLLNQPIQPLHFLESKWTIKRNDDLISDIYENNIHDIENKYQTKKENNRCIIL